MKRTKIEVEFTATTQPQTKQKRTFTLVSEGCKYYFNAQHLLMNIGAEARVFLDYLCEKMDGTKNTILINKELRWEFMYHFANITGRTTVPTDGSLTQYVSKFKKLGLIISATENSNGFYIVNPKYFYKGTEKARSTLIRALITTRIKKRVPIVALINTSEEEFFTAR